MAVGVVQRDDDIGRGLAVQHYGIAVGRAAFGDGGVAAGLNNADAGGRRRRIQEQQRVAGVIADEGIQVAVGVDVGKGRGGIAADIAQAKRVDDGGGKRGAVGAAGVLEEQRVADVTADEGIQVAVAIDVGQGRAGIGADIAQAKRVGDGRGKRGGGRAAGVQKKQYVAGVVAHEGIQIAIIVDVGKGRAGTEADIAQAKGVSDGGGERGGCRATDVLEKQCVALTIAHEGIQVAVAVDVGQGGAGSITDIAQAKGVSDGRGKRSGCRATGVLEKQRVAEVSAHEGIQVAVGVEVGKAGGGKTADIAQAERVGLRGVKSRCSHECLPVID
ncbi:MAG: hypothetical protein Q8Q50_00350 [Methylobacter sp.]|nr:hypothetical protein [Methylobacter sp.]